METIFFLNFAGNDLILTVCKTLIRMIKNKYTAVIKKSHGWWIGWVEEIPGVNCQEKTREELLETMNITLKEALEMNRYDALSTAESDFIEVVLEP
jgi:predicted RNase H-like HicB family nuclease